MPWFLKRTWDLLLGAAFGLFLFSRGKGPLNAWLLVNLVTWYVVSSLLVCLHELGHALVGRVVGLRVFWVAIGVGRPLYEGQFWGTNLRINLWPSRGATALAASTPHLIRLRLWAAVCAGPATHLAPFALCYLAAGRLTTFPPAGDIWSTPAPFAVLLYANALLLLLSLFSAGGGTLTRPDGHRLMQIPFWKEQEVAEYLATYPALEAYEFMRRGDLKQAVARYQAALALAADSYVLRHDLAVARLLQGEYEQARTAFVGLLSQESSRLPGRRLLLLNNIAWADLMLRRADLLREADTYSEEAIKELPNLPAIQGTRGAVLVTLGRAEEGLSLLKKSFRRHSEPSARASVACWIAIAETRTGHGEEARVWFGKAERLCPWLHLLDWTREETQGHSLAAANSPR